MGFIVLGVFTLFVFACFLSFIAGLLLGKKQAARDYAEELQMKIKSEKEFEKLKDEIKTGRFKGV